MSPIVCLLSAVDVTRKLGRKGREDDLLGSWRHLRYLSAVWFAPNSQRNDRHRLHEVTIGREEREIVANTKRSDQRIDCAQLNASPPASVANVSGSNEVLAGWLQPSKRGEALENLIPSPKTTETLQELLEHEPGHEDCFLPGESALQTVDAALLRVVYGIPSKSQRPDTGVDQQAQDRERSAL